MAERGGRKGKSSYDEKMAAQASKASLKEHEAKYGKIRTDTEFKSKVSADSLAAAKAWNAKHNPDYYDAEGNHKAKSPLSAARSHLEKETERGEHSPKIAGHETSHHGGRISQDRYAEQYEKRRLKRESDKKIAKERGYEDYIS